MRIENQGDVHIERFALIAKAALWSNWKDLSKCPTLGIPCHDIYLRPG